MEKEVKTSSKKTQKSYNKKNEGLDENLKNISKNIKKEFYKAKDIIVKEIKANTNNIPSKIKNIKENIYKKIEQIKCKKTKEDNDKIQKSNSTELNKKAKSNNKNIPNNIINYIKKHLILSIVGILGIIFLIPKIFNNEIKYNYEYDYIEEIVLKYKVKINVDFEENLLFSKFDVDLSSDGQKETLEHGKDKIVEFYLEEGEHTISFTNNDNSEIFNQINIIVTSNMEIGVQISCHYNNISVTKIYTDKDIEMISNEIKMTDDKKAYVNKNYKDVIEKLEKLGFTNIEEKPIYDIELGWTEEGEVDNVKINGKDNYKRGDIFKNDVKVIVSYHMNANDDPSKIMPPYSGATSKKYDVVVKAFKDAGFTNVVAVEGANYFGETENTVSSITIDGESIKNEKKYKPNSKIVITYYGNPKDYDLKEEDELSLYYAKKAFEEYGKNKYRYGFKCHWILDLISREQSEDGKTWYFKVGVTIENAYGNKYDAIAEGIVSGNDYNHKVISFYVN